MNRFFKFFLLWLLIAVLPLQAIAAAAQTSCGPQHQSDRQAVHVVHHTDADASDMVSHDHHAGMMHSAMPTPAVSDGQFDHANHDQTMSCSSCAACCVGAFAFPIATQFIPLFVSARLPVIAPPALVTGFIPDGLERPPRQLSA